MYSAEKLRRMIAAVEQLKKLHGRDGFSTALRELYRVSDTPDEGFPPAPEPTRDVPYKGLHPSVTRPRRRLPPLVRRSLRKPEFRSEYATRALQDIRRAQAIALGFSPEELDNA